MFVDYCAISIKDTLLVKTAVVTFWVTFGNFGLLLISKSGHIDSDQLINNCLHCYEFN